MDMLLDWKNKPKNKIKNNLIAICICACLLSNKFKINQLKKALNVLERKELWKNLLKFLTLYKVQKLYNNLKWSYIINSNA